jgi:Hint domain
MATDTWTLSGTLWSVDSSWFTLEPPGTADAVELPGPGPYTSTVDVPFTVGSVTLDAAGITLDIAAALTATDGVAVAAGAEVDLVGTLAGGPLDLSAGGTLVGDGGTLDGTTLLGALTTIVGAGLITNNGSIGWSTTGEGNGFIGIDSAGFDNAGQIVLAPIEQSETNEYVTGVVSSPVKSYPTTSELSWVQALVANVSLESGSFVNSGSIEVDGGTLSIASATFDNSGGITLLGENTQTVEPIGTTDGYAIYGVVNGLLLTQVTVGAEVATFENTGTITAGSVVFEQAMTLSQLGSIVGGLTFDAGLDLGGGALDAATISVAGLLQDGSIGGTGTLTLQPGATLDNVAIGSGVLVQAPNGGPILVVDPPTDSTVTLDSVTTELEFETVSNFNGSIVLGAGASNDVIGVFTPGGVTLGPDFSFTDSQSNSVVTFGGGGSLLNDGTWTLDGASLDVNTSLDGTGTIDLTDGAAGQIETLNGTGTIELNNGATADISTLAAGAAPAVAFGTGVSTVVLPGTGVIGAVLSGLAAGDSVDLASVSSETGSGTFGDGGAGAANGTLDVQGASGQQAKVPLAQSATGLTFTVVPDGSGGSVVEVACFAAGTRIATRAGEAPVETLRPGDLVRTLGGRLAPVRWVGWTRVDLARHPAPARAAPVCIRADAFARGQPRHDLFVSPEHCLFVDGALVPAFALLNGATIARRDRLDSVTYWHVELDRHDVLLAEGLPAESYLDTGNRALFAGEAGVRALHPDLTGPPDAAALGVWAARGCAPLRLVAPERRAALRARAEALGWRLEEYPGIEVLADGVPAPWTLGDHCLAVRLPAGATRLRVRSRSFVPAEHDAASGDTRRLGLAAASVCLGGWKLPADSLRVGWHSPAGEAWRWTDGDAEIALPRQTRPGLVELRLHRLGCYWQPPPRRAAMRDITNQMAARFR